MLPIVAVNRGPDARAYTERDRLAVPAEPTGRRIGSPEVELGYTPEQAREEAGRCLQCFLNIMLDETKCILCRGCVDVCPEHCISIVPVPRREPPPPDAPATIAAGDTVEFACDAGGGKGAQP